MKRLSMGAENDCVKKMTSLVWKEWVFTFSDLCKIYLMCLSPTRNPSYLQIPRGENEAYVLYSVVSGSQTSKAGTLSSSSPPYSLGFHCSQMSFQLCLIMIFNFKIWSLSSLVTDTKRGKISPSKEGDSKVSKSIGLELQIHA